MCPIACQFSPIILPCSRLSTPFISSTVGNVSDSLSISLELRAGFLLRSSTLVPFPFLPTIRFLLYETWGSA